MFDSAAWTMNDECCYFGAASPIPTAPYCDFNHYSFPPQVIQPGSGSYPHSFSNDPTISEYHQMKPTYLNLHDTNFIIPSNNYGNHTNTASAPSLSNSVQSVDEFTLSSSSRSPKQSATNINMMNMEKMQKMMKEMKQNMTQMMKMHNNIKAASSNLIQIDEVKQTKCRKKRQLNEYMGNDNDDDDDYNENISNDDVNAEEEYPKVGVRATTTIKMSKDLFSGCNSFHFEITQEILCRAIQRISEFRWVHSKYNVQQEDVKYLVFIDEDLSVPKEFIDNKPKRGRYVATEIIRYLVSSFFICKDHQKRRSKRSITMRIWSSTILRWTMTKCID